MTSNVITLKKISKFFKINDQQKSMLNKIKKSDKFKVLNDISFEISKGELIGIIGKNGSGKTTLLRIIAGIYNPSSGQVIVHGRISPLLQIGVGFRQELMASENIIISGMLSGMSKKFIKSKIEEILNFAELKKFENMKISHFSTGMKARLAFSTALQLDPDILLVDEVLSVGDANFREKSFQAFLDFKHKGKTILYATHNLAILKEICDRVILVDEGKILAIGQPDYVIEEYKKLIKK